MPRIFDNIELDLGPHLIETFRASDRMDTAVGYFNLRGWSLFGDAVSAKAIGSSPVVRILVGMTVADPEMQVLTHLQQALESQPDQGDVDRQTARTRKQQALLKFRTQLMRGVPNSDDQKNLRTLRAQLADGRATIKLFTRRPLHGKTYLCHRQDINSPIVGFVGSSNLTMSGLKHNYELNVDVLEFDAAKKLDQWFQDRWEDKFSLDITHDLIDLIDESWVGEQPRKPYEVYLKVCYHLSRDVREGLIEFSLPPSIREQLLEYQVNAVKTLARRIVTRGGTMLGDVVGLGKTITAIATALMLREEHGYSTLVVCPKNLVRMWESYLDAYDVPGRVVPYSMAAKKLIDLRRYHFVIVDESHTLRSDTRKDYQALHQYIRENGSKVLLLTATPYNIRFLDVANQLGLYIDEDDDLGLQPLAALANDPKLADRIDGKTNTMLAFRKSEEPDDWKRLMSDHLVRRTRSFVQANYSARDDDGREYIRFADGTHFYFPERSAKPLEHSFGPTDPAAMMASDATLDIIDRLLLPRYNLANFINPTAETSRIETELIIRLQRARGHLSGFVRTGLFKRLSSCGHSFTVSLERHLARNQMWLYALREGFEVPVGTVLDAMMSTAEVDRDADANEYDDDMADLGQAQVQYRALKRRRPPNVIWVRPAIFTDKLTEALEADSAAIRKLLDSFGEWTDDSDSKLYELARLVTDEHPEEKVLIFTEYKDTADYVTAALRRRRVTNIASATGETSDPTSVARRFSPHSNRLPGQAESDRVEDELRVLVATDVLSEGQNLQDAHIVVNYDLPWAIIRLIQRAGRVDRVGQQAPEVLVYSFFHEDVENVLRLRSRIRQRLQQNAEVFGSDERFFGSDEEVKAIEDLYNGKLDDDESDSDVDASSLAYEVWSKAEEEDPDLAHRIINMPDLVFATRQSSKGEGEGVVCYVRTEGGTDGHGFAGGDGSLTLLTGHETIRHFACKPTTLALTPRADHFDLTAALATGPLSKPATIEGRLRGVRKRVWNRLNGSFTAINPDVAEALDLMFRRPLTRDAEQRLKKALSTRPDPDELGDLVALLNRDNRLVVPDSSGSDPVRIVCTMGIRN